MHKIETYNDSVSCPSLSSYSTIHSLQITPSFKTWHFSVLGRYCGLALHYIILVFNPQNTHTHTHSSGERNYKRDQLCPDVIPALFGGYRRTAKPSVSQWPSDIHALRNAAWKLLSCKCSMLHKQSHHFLHVVYGSYDIAAEIAYQLLAFASHPSPFYSYLHFSSVLS